MLKTPGRDGSSHGEDLFLRGSDPFGLSNFLQAFWTASQTGSDKPAVGPPSAYLQAGERQTEFTRGSRFLAA
jgi:hypothetical protein